MLIGAAAMLGCGGDGPYESPSAPTSLAAPRSGLSIRPSDYHDPAPMPDPAPIPDPAPAPVPDPVPAPVPDPAPVPVPDPAPVPSAVTISIIGSFGSGAFAPNPIQAVVGDMVVWTNADATRHTIVLDDGTPVGDIAPGQSTTPMAVTAVTTTYHCTIHPSMVGTISDPSVPEPAPPPPPVYEPPPYDPY